MGRTLQEWRRLLLHTAGAGLPAEFLAHFRAVNEEPGPEALGGSGPAGVDPVIAQARAWVGGFEDDAGHRRDVDTPFLCRCLSHLPAGEMPAGVSELARAWWALDRPRELEPLRIDEGAGGALMPWLRETGVESWTETELGVMHALVWHGIAGRSKAVLERAFRAAVWMLDNLQPDNATNHPWAAHLFIAIALDPTRPEGERGAADLYAQSLLHNAVVHQGRPDRFSAIILWDAERCLSALTQVRWQRAPACVRHLSLAARDFGV